MDEKYIDQLREGLEFEQTEKKKKKKKKKWLLLLLLLLLCFACGGGYYIWKSNQPKSKFEEDLNALQGFLPGKTQAEIEAELNRIIKEGYFNASVNGEMTLENGILDVNIENVPANHFDTVVDIYLYPEAGRNENGQLIYESGIIKPGYYVETADVKAKIDPGVYNGQAVIHAIRQDESQEEMGKTVLNLVIEVK